MTLTPNDLEPNQQLEYQRWLTQACRQGFCETCAAETALGMVVGLHYLGDMCKACWKRLNPPLETYRHHNERKFRVRPGWVPKAAKPTTKRCDQCQQSFVPQRVTAKFCSARCRKLANRGQGRRASRALPPI